MYDLKPKRLNKKLSQRRAYLYRCEMMSISLEIINPVPTWYVAGHTNVRLVEFKMFSSRNAVEKDAHTSLKGLCSNGAPRKCNPDDATLGKTFHAEKVYVSHGLAESSSLCCVTQYYARENLRSLYFKGEIYQGFASQVIP